MEWSKLKNIILIMLAAVNLCLLFFVVQREWRDSASQRQNRQQAVDFLADRGIQIHEGLLPDDQMVPRPQTVERDQEEESRLAAQLLGEDVVVQARGAGVYRYQNGAGALQFHSDGSFSAELSPASFPLGADRERSCLDLLAQIGFEGEAAAREENTLTVRQSWEGLPLFNHQVTLVWGCLLYTSLLFKIEDRALTSGPGPGRNRPWRRPRRPGSRWSVCRSSWRRCV